MGYSKMSDSATVSSLYHFSLEKGNKDLVNEHVQKINTMLRRVRRINKDSQREMKPVNPEEATVSSTSEPVADVSSVPNIVEVLPDSLVAPKRRRGNDDTTEKFLIKSPSRSSSSVADAFKRALVELEEEESKLRRDKGRGSPVVRTWKIV